MTETEITRFLRSKYRINPAAPSRSRRYLRKNKLKIRFKGDRLKREIERTTEKLELLQELLKEARL
jgi:hypothetical protein